MTPEEIAVIAELARRRSGASVDKDRPYLVESRLAPVARREGFASIRELIQAIGRTRDERLVWAAVEALAPSETEFFRDRAPFNQFRSEVLPALAAAREGRVRIWSAGCSTGQEPYSLAMILDEARASLPGLKADILASDLSERCLEKAHAGIYTSFEVQRGLPSRLLIRHFEKTDEAWVLSPRLRQAVRWSRVNLVGDLRGAGRFDVIFCRNVVSGLCEEARKTVLEQLALALPEDGVLVLGLNETLSEVTQALRPIAGRRGFYARNPSFAAAA